MYRIFVNKKEFRKGYGLKLMQMIEEHFPGTKVFKLDTPEWNVRTNSFYQKCGYTAVGREHIPEFDLILYEKKRWEFNMRLDGFGLLVEDMAKMILMLIAG